MPPVQSFPSDTRLIQSDGAGDRRLKYPWNEMIAWVLSTTDCSEVLMKPPQRLEGLVGRVVEDADTFLDLEVEDILGDDFDFNESAFVPW